MSTRKTRCTFYVAHCSVVPSYNTWLTRNNERVFESQPNAANAGRQWGLPVLCFCTFHELPAVYVGFCLTLRVELIISWQTGPSKAAQVRPWKLDRQQICCRRVGLHSSPIWREMGGAVMQDWSDLLALSTRYCARASDSPGGGVRVSIKHLRTYTFLHTLQHYRNIALHSL